jgi:glycosyltransferase involved in cell wall biosynthesis
MVRYTGTRRPVALKIAVVSIALNEESFMERWVSSAADAEVVVLGDTGSTDKTVEAARDLGAQVNSIAVQPFRFDMARNATLALVPSDVDVVINVDVDEVLVEGWREQLESAPQADRYSYDYVWSWTANGKPDVRFDSDKCHSRFGWVWRHPCHENLYPSTDTPLKTGHGGFAIHHHPDPTKPRSQYLGLLSLAVKEDPNDARMMHYYARELFFHGKWDEARERFQRHLAMPSSLWRAERAQSLRYIAKMDYNPERWLWSAVAEDMARRDALVDLVDFYLKEDRPLEAAGVAQRALRIRNNPGDYMSTAHAYDDTFLLSVIQQVNPKEVRREVQPVVQPVPEPAELLF